jgi:hypothetical protein
LNGKGFNYIVRNYGTIPEVIDKTIKPESVWAERPKLKMITAVSKGSRHLTS